MATSPLFRPLLVSAAVFVGYLLAGLYVIQLELDSWSGEQHERTLTTARQYAAAIERAVGRAAVAAESMASYIRHHHGEVRDFDSHSADLIHHVGTVTAIELAPGGTVKHLFPAARFDELLGRPVAVDGDGDRPPRRFVFSGLVPLANGDQVVVGRQPVYLAHGQEEPETFWGYASVYISLDDLLRQVGLGRLQEEGLVYRLTDGDGRPLAGRSAPPAGAQPARADIALPGTTWRLGVVPSSPQRYPPSAIFQLVLVLVTGGAVTYLVFSLLWQPQLLRVEVAASNRALMRANALYHDVFSSIREVIFQVDAAGLLTLLNPAWRRITGFDVHDSLGRPLEEYLHPGDLDRYRELVIESLDRSGKTVSDELRLRARDNEIRWVQLELRVRVDESGGSSGHAGAMRDITDRKQADRVIHYQANYDSLTNLPNRKLFLDRFGRAIEMVQRNRHGLALLFIDLDRFKWINDSHGHATGDQLLKETARRLIRCVRKVDTVARFGGDEFVVLLPEVNGALDAEIVARKILAELARPFELGDHQEVISGSIGITLCPEDGTDLSALMNNADHVMYKAKQDGRNTFRFFTHDINEQLQLRNRMSGALRRAIDCDALQLEYQPIYTLSGRETVGIEALLRWESPEFGRVAPAVVIPLAEDAQLIKPLGDWVIERACRDFVALRKQLVGLRFVTVNISDRQFRSRGLDNLDSVLSRYGMLPHQFSIDIAESLLNDNRDEVWQAVEALQQRGVRLMLDDFGTGLSSLAHLKRLQPTAIKLQNAYLAGVVPEQSAAAVTGSIVAMAHSMGIEVIAEGLEEQRQLEMFELLGGDYGQGYYLCSPLPADALVAAVSTPVAAVTGVVEPSASGAGAERAS